MQLISGDSDLEMVVVAHGGISQLKGALLGVKHQIIIAILN